METQLIFTGGYCYVKTELDGKARHLGRLFEALRYHDCDLADLQRDLHGGSVLAELVGGYQGLVQTAFRPEEKRRGDLMGRAL